MKKIFILSLVALAALSCKEDDTLYYNNITMGNIDREYIVSDQGNSFEILENKVDLSAFEYGRVILACDVLKETGDGKYGIRLLDIASVLTKAPANASAITSEDDKRNVDNPVNIREIWYSGGYINMFIEFAVKYGSDTKHLINLIYDDSPSAADDKIKTYTFTLRHNAFGETPTEETGSEYKSSGGYVSFPVSDLIREDEANVTLNWHANKVMDGFYIFTESEQKTKTFDWKRTDFEHPALLPIRPTLKVCR